MLAARGKNIALAGKSPHTKVFGNAYLSMADFLDKKVKVDLALGFDAGYFCSGARTAILPLDCQPYGFEAVRSFLKEMTLAINNPHYCEKRMHAARLAL